MVPVTEETDYKDITQKITLKEGESYLLLPGQACLGITIESIQLSPKICGLLGSTYLASCSDYKRGDPDLLG